MAPKKAEAGASGKGGKVSKGGAAEKEKKRISVASITVGPSQDDKLQQRSSAGGSRAATAMAKQRKSKGDDYLAGVDLPPSDSEEEEEGERLVKEDDEDGEGEDGRRGVKGGRGRGSGVVIPDLGSLQMTDRQAKKKEKKEQLQAQAAEEMRKEALKEDDDSAFSVVIGSKISEDTEGEGTSVPEDNAKDIKLENFSVSAKGKELFRNASLTIVHGRRYGLVGPNGKGKSTIMKLIARRKLPVPRGIDVLMVEQEVVADDKSALEAVVTADVELIRLREEEARLRALIDKYAEAEEGPGKEANGAAGGEKGGEEAKGDGEGLGEGKEAGEGQGGGEVAGDVKDKKWEKKEKRERGRKTKGDARTDGVSKEEGEKEAQEEDETEASEKLTAVYERMGEIGAESAEARASKILAGLGFTKEMQARATKSFSGGWRMRISLARALYVQPTLLLLDEPTNHLDLRAVLWLEEYLMRWKKTLIVVSHDRDFLNSVCTDIIHLHDMKLHLYKGNFESFEEMYEQKRRENNKQFEKYEKQLRAAKKSGNREKQDQVMAQAKRGEERRAAKKGGKKGSSGADADEDGPKEAPTKWRDYTVEFHFPEPTELQPPLLQLRDVAFQYPGRPDFGLKDIDVAVDMGTRVAIVGPNGAGKSTLLNLLVGDLEPTEGESRQSQKLRVGRYSQHFVDKLTMDENPVEYLLRLHPDQEGPSRQEAVRSRLGKFGLPGHNHLTPIVKLSGGQKARVVFTEISMSKPHILLLDEPTNHLDMQSIDALADALDEFSGGVVLVSHDSRLISRVCDDEERSEIWVVDNGTCKKFPGTFEEYKEQLLKEIIAEVEE